MGLKKYKLGELIKLCDNRNSDNYFKLSDVKGISIKKEFIETKADIENVKIGWHIFNKAMIYAAFSIEA